MKYPASYLIAAAAAVLVGQTNALRGGESSNDGSNYAVNETSNIIDATTTQNDVPTDEEDKTYDAVIVGAGWAGIRAALTLLEEGVSSILVLEASDYIGGRSKSVNSDGSINKGTLLGNISNVPIDMGSEWQFAGDNRMDEYLEDNGLMKGVDLENLKDDVFGNYYTQSKSTNGTITTEIMEDTSPFYDVWNGWLDFREEKLEEVDDISWLDAMEEYKVKGGLTEEECQYLNMIASATESEYAADASTLSLSWVKYKRKEYPHAHYMSYRAVGYGNVAAKAAGPIQSKIRLNSKVVEVNSEGKNLQTVKYEDENGEMKSVKAKTVLVTVSLGILQAGIINFVPTLPNWKQEVIDNMEMGLLNKCVLQWENEDAMVWPEPSGSWIELVTAETETSGRWTQFYNPSSFKDKPVLIGMTGGDEAREMESQTDDEVLDDVMQSLRAMYPNITRPDKIFISRWGQDPNVLGTYSVPNVGRNFDYDSEILGKNVGNVWFAGEATAGRSWHGCTVGGWETGEKAARDMARKLLSKQEG